MAYPLRPKNLKKSGIDNDNVAALRDLYRKVTTLTEGQPNQGGVGALEWNADRGTYDINIGDGQSFKIGEDVVYYAQNTSGSTIPIGSPVMFTGAVGASGVLTFGLAVADGSVSADYMMGVTLQDVPKNNFGYVKDFGLVRGFRTDGVPQGETWADGDLLYFDPATPGTWTNVQPTAPNIHDPVAVVVTASSGSNGSIFVRMRISESLTTLQDVYVNGSLSDGKLLIYDLAQGRWESNTLTAGTNISITNGPGSVTIASTSTATVSSVALSAPTGFTVSGSPITTSGTLALDFAAGYSLPTTASQANWDTAYGWGDHAAAGYLTSYTETDPVFVASPAYGITNTQISNWDTAYGWGDHAAAGYLTTETYTGTVTSVSGTGSVNGITLSGTVTTSGSLTLGGTLSNVSLTSQVTGTLPVSNGGTGTATAFTAGSVVFAGASGVYSQDNSNFFWDDTNNKLGVGNTNPGYAVDISSSDTTASLGYALRLRSNATAAASAIQFTDSGATAQNGIIAVTDSGEMKLQADGASSAVVFYLLSGTERFRVGAAGQIGLNGTNYGTSGQVLSSQGSGSAATWLSLATVATTGSFGDLSNKPGIRSNGQNVVAGSKTLGSADSGTNILIVASGITITFPSTGFASGEGFAISNVSGGNVTLSCPGGSDFGTTLPNNGSFFAFSDGGGFWRQYCYSTSRL